MKKWKCSVCGYIHTGEEPPENCPVCGADKSKFILLEDEATDSKPNEERVEEKSTDSVVSDKPKVEEKLDSEVHKSKVVAQYPQLAQLMTKYHAHPITVHIPNGVLPLSVIFTFLAVIFNSEAFATAASINMLFVFFAMPFVLFSGYIDWVNRFGGNMTKIFRIKMICGGIVTILAFILTIWWMIQPDILLKESSGSALFIFFHLATLIPAIVAGFYGGKLVFLE